ncbi:MAG: biotin--[acetyl-CoA-carboxylase] ligase [Rikenellaceae bacterium]|nr:biotin--[acetyl-CoA-carboxylase] ligase [Rikenellaceae bacterium]
MEDFVISAGPREYRVRCFAELSSTNDEAASDRYREGDLIIAEAQTRGRGQRGNRWHSTPGLNLTFSLVTEPRFLPAGEQFLLSEAVSLAVVDTLRRYAVEAAIKWPNDIYVGDRKIAGILIENDICGAVLARSVIGVGLNVNETSFPDYLPNPVSMSGITGRADRDVTEVLSGFIRDFDTRYTQLSSGHTDTVTTDYDGLIYRKNIPARFRRPSGEIFEGTILRVEPSGQLIIENSHGHEEAFLFKEVEFK